MHNSTDTKPPSSIEINGITRPVTLIGNILPRGSKTAGIYALLHLSTGAMYVGSASDIGNRVRSHFKQLRNREHKNYKLQNLYNQYPDGWAWVLLEPMAELDRSMLYRLENRYIKTGLFDLNIDKDVWSPFRAKSVKR